MVHLLHFLHMQAPNSHTTFLVDSIFMSPMLTQYQWFLDAGATHHLTRNISNMQFAEPYIGIEAITVTNGITLPIKHCGSSVCLCQ